MAAFSIPQHLPGGIEGNDLLGIAAGIGMVAFHQGPVSRLDLSGAGRAGHPQNRVVVGGRHGGGGRGIAAGGGQAREPGLPHHQPAKSPPFPGGLGLCVCVCEEEAESDSGCWLDQNLNWVCTKPPKALLVSPLALNWPLGPLR